MQPLNHSARSNPIVVRGPAALAVALPYLLEGPTPGSLVLAVLSQRCRLQSLTARRLPAFPAGASQEVQQRWAEDATGVLVQGLSSLALLPDEQVAAVLYLPEGLGRPPACLAERLRGRAARHASGGRLLDVVAVFEGRWRSLLCQREDCCPPDGARLLEDAGALEAHAALIAAAEAGQSALPAARHRVSDGDLGEALARLPHPRSFTARRALLRQVWPVVQSPADELPATVGAALLVAAERPGVRDALLTRMVRAGERRADWWPMQLQLWRRVLLLAPVSLAAGPGCLAAISAWALRDPSAAVAHLEQALIAEPEHRMAVLLLRLIEQDGAAAEWFSRVKGLDEADCLRFDRPPNGGMRRAAG